ncbi:response regulator transcription factor [Pedobacter antarcticus]|uniref:response regulator transcription factor n=1 Tax=Pedobacter antarcticus TaxID=34086 RepID=UPI001C57860F|nr:helix-turn-helix transcriptional regulator [Pedobacter antarcticus]
MNLLINNYGIPALNFEVNILTPREIEVIKRVLLPSKNIAYDLNISEHTVSSHLTNIKNKTGMLDKYHMAYFLGTRKELIN